jgi:hypothetical protein
MHNSFRLSRQHIFIIVVGFWFCSGCNDEQVSVGEDIANQQTTDENDAIDGSDQTSDDTFGVSDGEPEIENSDAVGLDEDTEATTVDSDDVNSPDSDDVADTTTVDSDEANPADDEKGSDADVDTYTDEDAGTDSEANADVGAVVDAGVQEVPGLTSSEKAIAIGNCRLECFAMALPRVGMCLINKDREACESECIETTQSCSEECVATDGSGYSANTEVDQKSCPPTCASQETAANSMCLVYTTDESQKACHELAVRIRGECSESC